MKLINKKISYLLSAVLLAGCITTSTNDQLKYFKVGFSKQAVLEIQGQPLGIYGNTWRYGKSFVFFKDDRVSGYRDSGDLKVTPEE